MEQLANVYARSLFAVAVEHDKLDVIHEQLAQFARAVDENRDLAVFLFSPYFSAAEKQDGVRRMLDGAEPELLNFLLLLAEKHRLPLIFRIDRVFLGLYAEAKKLLPATITSAIELPGETAQQIGRSIEAQTGRTVELTSRVDPDILGGLIVQVGNMVLDASIRNRLEKLRKQVSAAAA